MTALPPPPRKTHGQGTHLDTRAGSNACAGHVHGGDEGGRRALEAQLRGKIAGSARPLEEKIAALREQKHSAPDAEERERIDREINGPDGKGGLEGELRDAIAESLDDILPEAFATAREGARRLLGTTAMVAGHETPWNMVHYDVQLIGGIQLHFGEIAEMATGEGQPLVATRPRSRTALAGRGAHLFTVNY